MEFCTGDRLLGLCYRDGNLYTAEAHVELHRIRGSLAVYQVDSGSLTLLDRLELGVTGWGEVWSVCPRVERDGPLVFIPCVGIGVTVARLAGDRLVRERTLRCVKRPESVDVMSRDIVYVCDWHSYNVRVVDVRNDRIASTLETPDTVRKGDWPRRLAVLGDSVLVGYDETHTLVVYRHGSPTPVRMIPRPGGLEYVSAINTDFYSHFIITDQYTNTVFVVDLTGKLRHKVNIDTGSVTRDCAVINRQLWVACEGGDIVLMSSH